MLPPTSEMLLVLHPICNSLPSIVHRSENPKTPSLKSNFVDLPIASFRVLILARFHPRCGLLPMTTVKLGAAEVHVAESLAEVVKVHTRHALSDVWAVDALYRWKAFRI